MGKTGGRGNGTPITVVTGAGIAGDALYGNATPEQKDPPPPHAVTGTGGNEKTGRGGMLRYWGEWLTVVLHPVAYVRFCKARAEAERLLAVAIAERPVETEREYIYVGPWVKDRGVPMTALPRC